MISYQSVTNRSIIAAPFPVLLVFRQKNNLFFLSKTHADRFRDFPINQ